MWRGCGAPRSEVRKEVMVRGCGDDGDGDGVCNGEGDGDDGDDGEKRVCGG